MSFTVTEDLLQASCNSWLIMDPVVHESKYNLDPRIPSLHL